MVHSNIKDAKMRNIHLKTKYLLKNMCENKNKWIYSRVESIELNIPI